MNADTWSLVIGFILTTGLGGFLGAGLQRMQWSREARLDIAKQGYVDATALLDDVYTLVDKRYYHLFRWYRSVYDEDTEKKVGEREAAYFVAVREWNEKLRSHHQSIRRHLGVSHAVSFLDYHDDLDPQCPTSLHYRFVLCTGLVHRLKSDRDIAPLVLSEIEKLNWHLTEFALETTTELMKRSQSLSHLRSTDWSKESSASLTSRPQPRHPAGSS